ncbi:MAG: SPFH domain-containing protein, partial [Planctomycetaceae bacterium]
AYGSAAPDETIRAVAESVIRQVAARTSLDGMLTTQRADVERECLELIRDRVEGYGFGVEITGLNLLDIHPPRPVVPAYRDVADALEQREQLINEAEAYYAQRVLSAGGERAIRQLSKQTGAGGDSSTTGGVTDWRLNDDLWGSLTQTTRLAATRSLRSGALDSGDERFIYLGGEAAAVLLTARQEATGRVARADGQAHRYRSLLEIYQRRPDLTSRELYRRMLEDTLAERPLTIIDPKASGRQHLFLVDPETFGSGPLMPQLLPGETHEEPRPPLE